MNARSILRIRSACPQRSLRCYSSRKFMIGGNWKCNGTVESVKTLVSDLNDGSVPSDVDIVCAPVFIHLPYVLENLNSRFDVSAQNCWTEPGAFTGEVSADMLVDMGIPWVITGHSERRALIGETSQHIGEKSAYAINKGLSVIACVGESLPERESGRLWDVLSEQMSGLKDNIPMSAWSKMVIAYEPVWAIGTGEVATPDQAQEVHAWIRDWMSNNISPSVADSVRILYGGSVKSGNCTEIGALEDVDGFLVGGASLDGAEFTKICNARAGAATSA